MTTTGLGTGTLRQRSATAKVHCYKGPGLELGLVAIRARPRSFFIHHWTADRRGTCCLHWLHDDRTWLN